MYVLQWRTPALDVNKGTPIQVPVGSVVSDKSSLRFTGKGAANYGAIQQENLMRLLENFAGPSSPQFPTVGETWYDTTTNVLKVCSSVTPLVWKPLAGVNVTDVGQPAPTPAALGDMWFERTGSASGILYVYDGIGRYPSTATTVGGWNQVWPTIEIAGGREEYDFVLGLVSQVLGSSSVGGSEAIGKNITLTNLLVLDQNLIAKYNALTPLDPLVLTPPSDTAGLKVDPNSQDWDLLLAAAKYAVSRIELPTAFNDDISPVPFVSDGRQAPLSLVALPTSEVRYPSIERRAKRRLGSITLGRLFAETANVLQVAVNNRYSLRGINGASGSNPNFHFATEVNHHINVGGPLNGIQNGSSVLQFTFPSAAARLSFFNSGGAIQLTMQHVPGPSGTVADSNFKTLMDQRGVIRLSADKVRVFGNPLPLTLVTAYAADIKNAPPGGGASFGLQQVGPASYTIAAASDAQIMNVNILFNGGGPMNGTFTISYEVIRNTETYLTPALTFVYGRPNPYAAGERFDGTPSMVPY